MNHELIPFENTVSPVKEKETGEVLTATQKIIVRLKAVREARNLTIPEIEIIAKKKVSRSTLYRFFEKDSEIKYNFDYQYTILPIQNALLVDDTFETGDDAAKEKVASFEASLQQKDEIITALRDHIEQLKAEHESRCAEYESRLALWQQQIAKKDDRMDRKDRVLDEKDKEIRQLRDRVDHLTDQLLKLRQIPT